MRQFYEAYRGQKKVSPLLTQLPWTHHLVLLGQARRAEEREFYMLAAIKGRWSSRELERQLHTEAFRRKPLGREKVSAALARTTSPTLVAEYQTVLPSKALLRRKLHELYAQLAPAEDGSKNERTPRKVGVSTRRGSNEPNHRRRRS